MVQTPEGQRDGEMRETRTERETGGRERQGQGAAEQDGEREGRGAGHQVIKRKGRHGRSEEQRQKGTGKRMVR